MEKMVEVEPATQDELRQDLKSLFQGAIRLTLEMVLEEELKAMVGARRFERVGSRKGHRNGTYLRRLLTSLGQIDVTVPRSREGGSPADVMGVPGKVYPRPRGGANFPAEFAALLMGLSPPTRGSPTCTWTRRSSMPAGPKGRERERARGLRRGPGRPPPAPGHDARP